MSGFTTNGLDLATFPLSGDERIAADTQFANGRQPQSNAVTVDDLAQYARPVAALTDAATISIDARLSNLFSVTLGGNRFIANPTNLQSGQVFRVKVVQDGTGNRTLTYGSNFKWVGASAPTLTTTASATDLLTFVYDGTSLLGSGQLKYA